MLIDDLLNLIDHESTVFSLCLQGDEFKQALSALMKKQHLFFVSKLFNMHLINMHLIKKANNVDRCWPFRFKAIKLATFSTNIIHHMQKTRCNILFKFFAVHNKAWSAAVKYQ